MTIDRDRVYSPTAVREYNRRLPISKLGPNHSSLMKENRPPKGAHLSLGAAGEALAIRFLEANRFQIVATNFVAPIGRGLTGRPVTAEIDIIAYDRASPPHPLAFIEVKTRSNPLIALPEAAVDLPKQRHIIKAARAYRRLLRLANDPFRYDVVSIVMRPAEEPHIQLLRGFFDERPFSRSRWLMSSFLGPDADFFG
ncbi:MAG: YraN family protein [Blastocatellia bacterium]|nr:YraN family protein [Blastocatellia bacterium]